ncbi:hypothetical protein PPROV_000690300 [Pycnococcus provasolii]|uniref:Single-stranded DNA binding protein Ssb-like OB fold domain-containing protein n=1 Tax=Pycnococcus provasolii TaxID=41880 RepID=A0A830HRT1_9CHLO|nr:hypothetical protein PPROV_000690300 [Pycnococcus provasolii]|mmetsp:Transcript_12485/g.31316  ORF Transcript_12485/g.31316 Transcript_12485/m.31316 type:complete len:134 (+) Transcript_12485:21-422(+)
MSVKSEPVFVTVSSLRPGTANHNLRVKVVDAKTVVSRRRQDGSSLKISECLVGDSTGVITFTARNEQVDLLKPGSVVLLRNAKIDMYKGSMRLAVDKWGVVEAAEAGSGDGITPKLDNDLSAVEYELVTVTDD